MTVFIRKVKEEYGMLGNMSPHPVVDGVAWPTAESLFQAMRFEDQEIREAIYKAKSGFAAKLIAKKYADLMVITPRGEQDLANMERVLSLKLEQHPIIREKLIESYGEKIIEDCSKRISVSGLYWGMAKINGEWTGENWLGRLWMKLREQLVKQLPFEEQEKLWSQKSEKIIAAKWALGFNDRGHGNGDYGIILEESGELVIANCGREVAEHIIQLHNAM